MKIVRPNNLDSLQQFIVTQINILKIQCVSSCWCKNA